MNIIRRALALAVSEEAGPYPASVGVGCLVIALMLILIIEDAPWYIGAPLIVPFVLSMFRAAVNLAEVVEREWRR